MNYIFTEQIGKKIDVYMDDILVKSLSVLDHLSHMSKMFSILRTYNVKLNSNKWTFKVLLKKIILRLHDKLKRNQNKARQD